MNKNLTELVFILDRSGSMQGLESDTIGGFNSMLEQQRKGEGDVLISTVLFDDKVEVLHDRRMLTNIENLTSEDYYVRGCTALLDAVGKSIKHISKVQKEMPKDMRPAKTMFVITTDGLENASRQFSYKEIKRMVEQKQEADHWEFIFLGANMDAISAAADIGIRSDRASNYCCDAEGTATNYRALSMAVTKFRVADACDFDCVGSALDNWDEEVKADYKARKKTNTWD